MVIPSSHQSDSSQTYAQATCGSHPNNTIQSLISDINKFLGELKLLINLLIALLTKVISRILVKNECHHTKPTLFLSFYSTQMVLKTT
jgi:hypothetical protein